MPHTHSHRARRLLAAVATLLAIGGNAAVAGDHRPVGSPSRESRQHTTNDLADVHATALRFGQQYGPAHVLVVFDIDNTLLAMNQDLGSDQWFGWQRDLIKADPDSPHAVARDFEGLLEAQGLLFTLSHMHPPQKESPDLVADLQRRGFPMVALTSRSHGFRAATERELLRNGYQFSKMALRVDAPNARPFVPYDLTNLRAANLLDEEARFFDLGEPSPVSYGGGIFMIAGQHKGAMLLTLFARCRQEISAVVFVDDRPRHTQRVHDAVARRGVIDVVTFHYSHQDDRVGRFHAGDKGEAIRGWQQLQKTLGDVFR